MKKSILILMVAIILSMNIISVFAFTSSPVEYDEGLTANTNAYPYTTYFRRLNVAGQYYEGKVVHSTLQFRARAGTVVNNDTSDWDFSNRYGGGNVNYQLWTYDATGDTWASATTTNSAGWLSQGDWTIQYANYDVMDATGTTVIAENSIFNFEVVITNPPNGYKDVIYDMVIGYQVVSKDADWGRFKIEVKSDVSVPISQNRDILEYEVISQSWSATPTDGKYYGGQSINIRYSTVGTKQVIIGVTDTATGVYRNDVVTFAIKEFTDTNGDGRDDETGQDLYIPPSSIPSDYSGDISGSISTLTGSFNSMRSGIMVIGSMISALYSFLPVEILSLINTVIIVLLIITLLCIIRGK